MKLDIVKLLASEVYVIYAPGIGWLKADDQTGMLVTLTEQQVLIEVMKRAEAIRNGIAEELGFDPETLDKAQYGLLSDDLKAKVDSWRFWDKLTESSWVGSGLQPLKGLVTDTKPFDTDKLLIGTPSGVMHLPTGHILPPSNAADRRVTKTTAVDPAPSGGVTPEFLEVMEAIPAEQRAYVRWHLARALVAEMARDMFIHTGHGANGKSLVMGCLYQALGDYAVQVDSSALSGQQAGYHLARLRGARFAYLEELEADAAVKPTIWKTLVKTPSITARDIYKEPCTFANTWTVAVNTNFTPTVDTGDGGVARRAKIIPWPFRYCDKPEEAHERPITIPDPDAWVFDKGNQAQMLRWLMDVLNDPEPAFPDCLRDARKDWHEENDVVGQFIAERCVVEPGSRERSVQVGEDFGEWLAAKKYATQGERVRLKKLNSWVAQHKGTERSQLAGGYWYYVGLRLKPKHTGWVTVTD